MTSSKTNRRNSFLLSDHSPLRDPSAKVFFLTSIDSIDLLIQGLCPKITFKTSVTKNLSEKLPKTVKIKLICKQ